MYEPTVLSTFSGVGGLDLGLARAGWRHVGLCESEPYRRAVLAERFPGVPIAEDVREVSSGGWRGRSRPLGRNGHGPDAELDGPAFPIEPVAVGLLCGGFPCQDLSVAGRRRGLAGERSGLFFEFARIAESVRPRALLIENVPGLLSSNGGRDFGELLGALADLGYGVGWRILDSRHFGVPQRRRRVFIVGVDLGGRAGAERAGEILALGASCERHPPAGREAGSHLAAFAGAGADGPGRGRDEEGSLVVKDPVYYVEDHVNGTLRANGAGGGPPRTDRQPLVVSALGTTRGGGHGLSAEMAAGGQLVTHSLTCAGHDASEDGTGRGTPLVPTGFHLTQDPISIEGASLPLGHKSTGNGVHSGAGVRRLTPRECERLQGFPDGWTLVEWRGKPAADSLRYAALGDAVTVPVAEWLGRRLKEALCV